MNQDLLWRRIGTNEQTVAEKENLVQPGENYKLTGAQDEALAQLDGWYRGGARTALLVAPTGAGKTAVEFRLAVTEYLARRAPVVVLAPTRDLLRQHVTYFRSRLAGTPLRVEELHGGVAPKDRKAVMADFASGLVPVLIASGLALEEEDYRTVLRGAGFLVVDDVNAFDALKHLKPLRGIHTPTLFATATPGPVEELLRYKEADQRTVTLDEAPFAGPSTVVHRLKARPGTVPAMQLKQVEAAIKGQLAAQGRVFVVARTRADVPKLARWLENAHDVPVFSLSGDMVDTREQAQRLRKFKTFRPEQTRVAMLEGFRSTRPSIMVGTLVLGSGLDVPDADLIVVTDADGFGEAELEQLVGRVGRRELASQAYLIVGTTPGKPVRRRR